MINLQLAKPINRIEKDFHTIKCLPYYRTTSDRYLSDVGPISENRNADIVVVSKWHIQLCFSHVKWNIFPSPKWSTSFRQRNSIALITELHQIDSNPTLADILGQHRDADIEIMSKWHIHVEFTNVEIRYLSDIEWCYLGSPIPSYFCCFHIGCYIEPTYSVVDIKMILNVVFISDLPIHTLTTIRLATLDCDIVDLKNAVGFEMGDALKLYGAQT